MTKMNFQEHLSAQGDSIERPANIPQGTYVARVTKQPSYEKVGQDGRYETCDFILGLVSAMEDVDATELEEYGDITSSSIRHRFMFDTEDKTRFDRSMYNMRRFLEDHLAIDGFAGQPLNKSLADSPNHQCLVTITWRPDPNDPEIMYNEVKGTAPIE